MQHEALLYSLDPKIPFKQLQGQQDYPYDINKYTKLEQRISTHHVQAMLASDTDFHYKLLPIRPKIQVMYYLGDISLLNKKILGIVGPRQMSNYSRKVLETLFASADEYDFVTIS